MADGVHAAMDAMQPSAADAMPDRIVRQPAVAKLRRGDDAPDRPPSDERVGFLG
jgi:hypothetical protein